MPDSPIPQPAVVVLVGASGSGKSTWAGTRYRPAEIVSSDALRGVVGTSPADQTASADALRVLDQIVTARTGRRLTTVIDTTGLERRRRLSYLATARAAQLAAVLVIVDTEPALARARNAARDRKVPEAVLERQLSQMAVVLEQVPSEGWDLVLHVGDRAAADHHPPLVEERFEERVEERGAAVAPRKGPSPDGTSRLVGGAGPRPSGLRVVLQVSRLPAQADPARWLTDVALAADQLGFHGLALMDHLIQIPQVGRAWEPILQPWVSLGLLAGLGTSLRLGTLVSPVTFHSAGVLAKTVATLDALTGGRAFCGLGAGWWEREHQAYGMSLPPPAERLDRLESTIETMRALWAPGTKPYVGRRVSLPETTCYPRPVGPIPILVGGSGERRTLKIAARWADGCNVPSDLDTVRRKVAVLHAHCRAVGRDPAEVEVTVLDLPVIGRDSGDTAARVERLRGRAAAATYAARTHAGTVDSHIRRYAELAELGVGTVFVSPPDLTDADDLERCRELVDAARTI